MIGTYLWISVQIGRDFSICKYIYGEMREPGPHFQRNVWQNIGLFVH